ncbi:bZIP transcription factor [Tropicibacter sp. S64]|uniref:bZIP transcription factor n=1 Tax=Tropicibacter sp. S64 TaxID=3415122 RepID=UPI003C7DD684
MRHLTSIFIHTTCIAFFSLPAQAENLINDDLGVIGNACIGPSCVAGDSEAAPWSGIILKATSPRIYFDSSNSTEIEWNLFASATNGGAKDFGISASRVSTSTTTPFLINGLAPTSSLIIEPDGIGFGTSLPQRELHVVDELAPTLRLEQDTSGGATSQILDLQLSDFGFQLVDVGTILNRVPLTIENGAGTHSLYVDDTSNVGLGTSTPSASLHVAKPGTARILVDNSSASTAAAREMFKMENNGGSYFTLANSATGNEWYFVHENNTQGRFFINHSDGGLQLSLTRTGDMTIPGQLFTAGSCAAGCDRVFDEDYPLPTIAEQAAMMKANRHLPNVGPTPENGPFNLTQMTGGMLNELEKAHLYIAELEARVADLEAERDEISDLRRQVDVLLKVTGTALP